MKQINFDSTPIIPTEGITLLVRDNVVYHTWGNKSIFSKLGACLPDIYTRDIKDSDKIYNFPNDTDIVKTLNSGSCLDKFLYKGNVSKEVIREKIKEMINNGLIIGNTSSSDTRVHINGFNVELDCPTYRFKDEKGKGSALSDFGHKGYTWYEFDNVVELANWLTRKSFNE